MRLLHPTSGADLFTRQDTTFNRIQAWATRGRKEGKTLATHQAKFYDPETIVNAVAGQGVRKVSWDEYWVGLVMEGVEFAIVERMVEPTVEEVSKLRASLDETLGWHYSLLELPLQFLDGLWAKLFQRDKVGLDCVVFRRMGELWKRGVICSKTSNRPDIKLGWKPKSMQYASPDESWDWDLAHPAEWRVLQVSPGWVKGFNR